MGHAMVSVSNCTPNLEICPTSAAGTSPADDASGVAGHYRSGGDLPNHDAAGADNGPGPDRDSRSDESPSRHPRSRSHENGSGYQRKIRGTKIVRSGTQTGILRNDRARS